MNAQTNKNLVIGVIVVLVLGLFFLGYEVGNLRAEVVRLSHTQKAAFPGNVRQPTQKALSPFYSRAYFDPGMDPFTELSRMQRQMDRMYREALNQGRRNNNSIVNNNVFNLTSDIKEDKDKYEIKMDIPGMDKDQINVEVKNNQLLVSGERNNDNEEKDANYYARQRSFGYFSEALPLPDNADVNAITVDYKKGVLKIDIPKLAKAEGQAEETTKIKVN